MITRLDFMVDLQKNIDKLNLIMQEEKEKIKNKLIKKFHYAMKKKYKNRYTLSEVFIDARISTISFKVVYEGLDVDSSSVLYTYELKQFENSSEEKIIDIMFTKILDLTDFN